MRDHYRQFSHPVLYFAPDMEKDLLAEFDTVAVELRAHPTFVEGDLQIAFPQLCRLRGLDLRQDWLWLFEIWRDHDRGQRAARFAALCDERAVLFDARASLPPEHRDMLAARLYEIGRELAEFNTPNLLAAPLGEWG